MKKILILGGTHFIGRNLVENLLKDESIEITLFNRGKTDPHLFKGVKKILGNRNSDDILKIQNIPWDYIIDLSAYFPDSVKNILKNCDKATLKKYIFISTCSVYNTTLNQNILRNENSPIWDCSEEERSNEDSSTYGNRKAACEKEIVQSKVPYVILRPSLVFGKYDTTDRFYYWLYMAKKNKEILVPNEGKSIFSLTYVDDLVQTIISSIDGAKTQGIYNVISEETASISRILNTALKISNAKPVITSADSQFLSENQISQWMDLPLWLDCDYFTFANDAWKNDFEHTPTSLKQGIESTMNYYHHLEWPMPTYGISLRKHQQLLTLLNKR